MLNRIPSHPYTVREQTVADILAQVKQGDIKTFLNVGFHSWQEPCRHWWIKICEANGIEWEILEAYPANVAAAIAAGCPRGKIFGGGILNTEGYKNYDCILFWHGPEHVDKDTFEERLEDIEGKANKLIILGMPLGHEPQGAAYGNPFERHVSDWYPEDWKRRGYEVVEVHDRQPYPHMTVYRRFSRAT